MSQFVKRDAPLRKDGSWISKDGLDEGIYKAAAKQGITVSMFLENMRSEAKSEQSIYQGMTQSEVMRTKRALAKAGQAIPQTAFEEALQMAGIKAFGSNTDNVSKFFELSDTDVLFPEFVSNRIGAGLLLTGLVNEFSMAETVIPSEYYMKIYLDDVQDDRQLREVGKAEVFPETKIKVSSQSVRLVKYGRYITMAYEDIKYQRLNVFGKFMERIGMQIDIDRTDDMFYILVNGDGNSNTPGTTVETATSGTIGVADLISWANGAPSPYKIDKFAGKKALLNEYLVTLADFQNPIATWGFMGVDLPRSFEWDRSIMTTDYFVGVDSRYAVEHLTTGAIMTESEKLIRAQVNGTAVSHCDGFSIFDKNAVAIFDETH